MKIFLLPLFLVLSLSAMNEESKKEPYDDDSKKLISHYKEIDFVLRLMDEYLNKENEPVTLEDEANILNQLNPCLEKLQQEFNHGEANKENTDPASNPGYYVKRFPHYEE